MTKMKLTKNFPSANNPTSTKLKEGDECFSIPIFIGLLRLFL